MVRVRQAAFPAVLISLLGLALCVPSPAQDAATGKHVGLPVDWSHGHVLISNAATIQARQAAAQDPRMRSLWLARTRAVQGRSSAKSGKNKFHIDWSVSLGAGSVAPAMSPAKYTFDVNATPSCASDFVVLGLNVAGSASQANLVALNNLYSGNLSGNVGLCGTGSATVMWAYNVSSAGGSILTSPSISLDGKKIAFVESTSTSSIFRVLTYDPCTVSVTPCAGNGSSATSPKVPGSGNAASMTSPITYANVTNTRSSPWIDYHNDAAYVGADNATIYRITGVFNGTPALDTNFGPITLSNNCASVAATPAKITGPVQVLGASGGLDTGFLFVGDDTGCLTAIDIATRTVIGSVKVGGFQVGTFIPPVFDSPMVDASNSNLISVFGTASSSNNSTSFGGVSVLNAAALVQAQLDTVTPAFTAVSAVPIGAGATSTLNLNLHAPAFDNNYYAGNISGTTGFMYMCGTQPSTSGAPQAPTLYRVGFTAGSPPTMNTAVDGTPLLLNATNGVECSPTLEFANPSLAKNDLLFVSIILTNGLLFSYDITGAMPTTYTSFGGARGGSSGIIIDNTQLANQQGSSVYFSTLANGTSGVCNGVKCAVKLTQSTLQ